MFEAPLFIEPKRFDVVLDLSEIAEKSTYTIIKPRITNSEVNSIYENYTRKEDSIYKLSEFKELNLRYANHLDMEWTHGVEENKPPDSLLASQSLLDYKINNLRRDFSIQHANSAIAPHIILNEGNGFEFNVYAIKDMELICNSFKAYSKNSPLYNECFSILHSAKRLALGEMAPAFSLQSSHGKHVSLDSFKGKYVLLFFWAHWCGNCTDTFDTLKKAYQINKNKDFEIIGVSDDPEVTAWKSAIEKHKLPWQQLIVNDHSTIADDYDLKDLPSLFLLDKEGKIIQKEISIKTLEKELNIILNKE